MIKKFVVFVAFLLIITGCLNKKIIQDDDIERFYLNDLYYGNSEFIKVSSDEFKGYQNGSYVLYIYNNYCTLSVPCEDIFKEFMEKYQISFLSMPFKEFKEVSLYENVKYAPSIIIVNDGEVIDFLDANSDNDLIKYQDISKFEEWMNNYIYFSRRK